jgi:hypothetical protein
VFPGDRNSSTFPAMRHSFAVVLGVCACASSLLGCSSSSTGGGGGNSTGVDGGSGGSTASDGGGSGGDTSYVAPTGAPVTAPDKTWTWVDVPGAKCRDGSAAGFAVNLNSASNKLMIFLEGGGACYNQFTCGVNPASYDHSKFAGTTGGILDRSQAANPVADWNFVYVPFCTGDVHGGSAEDVEIPGVPGKQQFVGYKNLGLFLDRIVPTLPKPAQVLHTGDSAGGFGAALTAQLVERKFPPGTNITLLDDSGPAMSKTYVPECLQKGWRTTWGFDQTILKDCGADCPNPDDYELDWSFHLVKQYPKSRGGMIETVDDGIITLFYGYGTNDCAADPAQAATPVTADVFQAGLLDFRAQIKTKGQNFGTFFIPGAKHTWLKDPTLYTQEVGGVKLIDWVTNIIEGTGPIEHVGP